MECEQPVERADQIASLGISWRTAGTGGPFAVCSLWRSQVCPKSTGPERHRGGRPARGVRVLRIGFCRHPAFGNCCSPECSPEHLVARRSAHTDWTFWYCSSMSDYRAALPPVRKRRRHRRPAASRAELHRSGPGQVQHLGRALAPPGAGSSSSRAVLRPRGRGRWSRVCGRFGHETGITDVPGLRMGDCPPYPRPPDR